MSKNFQELGLIESLVAGLNKAGIHTPTEIQTETIPVALTGQDIVGQSATGTGKTLAYLLPIIQKLETTKRECQAIILAPTHELAIQVQRQIEQIVQNSGLAVVSAPIIGNVNIARQIEKLKDKPHIIVGSSGRILELIKKRKITAQTVKTIVLDEADRLLDDNNADSVKAVIKTTLRDRQMMLFSATITRAVLDRAADIIREPKVIKVESQVNIPASITHMYIEVERRDKIELLRKLVRNMNIERALVFINKSDNIAEVAAKLNYHDLAAEGIHGSSIKTDRKEAIEKFRTGKIQLLVASDIAARGLDIPGITHVVNLDFPEDAEVYLHRVGRTGRAGQSGTAISLVTKHEALAIEKFERVLKINIAAKSYSKGKIWDVRPQQFKKEEPLKQ